MALGELGRTPTVDGRTDELLGTHQEREAYEDDDGILPTQPVNVIVVDVELELTYAQHRLEQSIHLLRQSTDSRCNSRRNNCSLKTSFDARELLNHLWPDPIAQKKFSGWRGYLIRVGIVARVHHIWGVVRWVARVHHCCPVVLSVARAHHCCLVVCSVARVRHGWEWVCSVARAHHSWGVARVRSTYSQHMDLSNSGWNETTTQLTLVYCKCFIGQLIASLDQVSVIYIAGSWIPSRIQGSIQICIWSVDHQSDLCLVKRSMI